MLVTMMEHAYLLYTSIDDFKKQMREYEKKKKFLSWALDSLETGLFGPHPPRFETHVFETQWPSWEKYFQSYCSQRAFRDYWKNTVTPEPGMPPTSWHDSRFERYVNKLMDGIPEHKIR